MKCFGLILLHFSLTLIGCKEAIKTEKESDKKNISYVIINQDNQIFKVYYTPYDNEYSSIDSLRVEFKNNSQMIILTHKNMSLKTQLIDVFPIYVNMDFNFDGINDIMLYPHVENYSVYGHDYRANYFLYNRKNNRFEENVQLDTISNLDVCNKSKYLISKNRNGLVKYKWDKDSLKPIELLKETDLENGQFSIKETNLIEKTKKDYISKKSVVSDFPCE